MRLLLLSFLSALLLPVGAVAAARPPETGFLNRVLKRPEGLFRYVVYVPADYSRARQWPVILFLHGSGERGADGLAQTNVGLPAAIRKHLERWPAVVVMPQCPGDLNWNYQSMADAALATLAQTTKEFKTDPARVYLTGLSMGGGGAWFIAAQHPDMFAAVVPICGRAYTPVRLDPPPPPPADPYALIAQGIGKRVPVWAFHGALDPIVPVTESQQIVAALRAVGATVQYTEYPDVEHISWDRAYDDPALPQWLFSQHRPAPGK